MKKLKLLKILKLKINYNSIIIILMIVYQIIYINKKLYLMLYQNLNNYLKNFKINYYKYLMILFNKNKLNLKIILFKNNKKNDI